MSPFQGLGRHQSAAVIAAQDLFMHIGEGLGDMIGQRRGGAAGVGLQIFGFGQDFSIVLLDLIVHDGGVPQSVRWLF